MLNVVGKLVEEVEDLQESMEIRKKQLLLENGLEWRTFRSYVDTVCMYMVSCFHEYNYRALIYMYHYCFSTDVGIAEGTCSHLSLETSVIQRTQVCGEDRG